MIIIKINCPSLSELHFVMFLDRYSWKHNYFFPKYSTKHFFFRERKRKGEWQGGRAEKEGERERILNRLHA